MTRSRFFAIALPICFWLSISSTVRADRKPDLTPTEQAIEADLIIVGKVDSLEADLVQLATYPGSPKRPHQVGSIKIAEGILGAKGLTHARVGFIPQPPMPQPNRYPDRGPPLILTVGQEAVFFLKKHPESDLYLQIPMGRALDKKNPKYDTELESVKKLASIFVDPMKSLKADNAADRQFAACALVMRYNSAPTATDKTQIKHEPTPAEESKLILNTLTEMEWGKYDPDGVRSLTRVFLLMNLTAAEGWTQPKVKANEDANKVIGEAARKWLKDHAETYRIQRHVWAKAK